jgi:hypothetical protein
MTNPQTDEIEQLKVGLLQVSYILKSVANGDDQSAVAGKASAIVETAEAELTRLREQIAAKDEALRKAEEALVSQGYASNGPTLIAVRAALTNTTDGEK